MQDDIKPPVATTEPTPVAEPAETLSKPVNDQLQTAAETPAPATSSEPNAPLAQTPVESPAPKKSEPSQSAATPIIIAVLVFIALATSAYFAAKGM